MNLKRGAIGDTAILVNRCKGFCCQGGYMEIGPFFKDPISRMDLYSDRAFGPDHPSGLSLNSFLFYDSLGKSKPIEEWNENIDSNKRISNVLGVNFPDSVKGATLFICVFKKRSGQTIVDSSMVILE